MKGVFYTGHPRYGAISNNGGSLTIVKSCEQLIDMGHEFRVVARNDNMTWVKHRRPLKSIPGNSEVVIAISISDINLMLKKAPKDARKAYWMRGFEKWRMPKKDIYRILEKFSKKHLIMCNAQWMVDNLGQRGIPATLQYSGLDLDFWEENHAKRGKKLRIGCLYHTSNSKKWSEFERLRKRLGKGVEYAAFGNNTCKAKWLAKYRRRPNPENLRRLYQSCHFWFAPTKLEGFHQPPAEACLCGALVICSDRDSNGMRDWALPEAAIVYHKSKSVVSMIDEADFSKVAVAQRLLREKIGSREDNMKKMVEVLGGR